MVLRILVQNHLGTWYSGYQDRIIPLAHGSQDTWIESLEDMVLGILRQYCIIYLGHMVFRILGENLLHSPTALRLPHIVALLGQLCKENMLELWQMNLSTKQCCRPNTISGFRTTQLRFQTWFFMTKTWKHEKLKNPLMDVQASPQKRTSSTSKHEIRIHKLNTNPDPGFWILEKIYVWKRFWYFFDQKFQFTYP